MHEGVFTLDVRRSRPARFSSTKFTPPEPSNLWVERPQLVTRVERGLVSGLSMVVGSAGAGKTSLLVDWARSDVVPERTVCWMNVDEADCDPVRFWQALTRAVQTCHPGFGDEVIDRLVLDRSVEPDMLEMLVDEFDRSPTPISVVVDDLHLAGGAVDASLRRLINRRTSGLRLVIGSRTEPSIDLARLRAAERISEVRDADLMLDADEAATLLSRLGVEIDDDDLALLMERTEGWAAGLHLAGVALRETHDPEGFVDRLSKSNQVLSHYLTTQVFDLQPLDVQRFLLDTCVVDELTPELAGVLSGGSSVTLFDIEAANLLLLRNNAAGPVFHYHHLLAELLRLRLRAHELEHERRLHQLAADWYAAHGEPATGFRHLWRANRRDEALRLLDDTLFPAFWADELPPFSPSEFVLTDDDIVTAPGPSVGFVTSLVIHPYPVQAGLLADRIERLVGARLTDGERVTLLCIRTLSALARLNVGATIEYGEAAHALGTAVGVRTEVADATAAMLVRAYAWSGDFDMAEQASQRVAVDPTSPMHPIEHNGAVAVLELMRGRLGRSIECAERALDTVVASRMTGTAMQHSPKSVLGSALLERGDIMAAEPLLREVSSVEALVRIPSSILAKVALSRLWRSRGDIDAASALLDTARQLVPEGPGTATFTEYIDAHRSLFMAGIGDLESSARIAEQLSPGFRRDHVEARLLITRGDLAAAHERLLRMQQSTTCSRTDLELALTKLALAIAEARATDDIAEEVVGLAAQEGFVFALPEAGSAVFETIRVQARRMPRSHFVDVLLRTPPHSTAQRPIALHAPDVLSERERIVLRYIATSMSYREIADELFISVNTVKSHVKSVIRKMQADSRAEAIARARELHYL